MCLNQQENRGTNLSLTTSPNEIAGLTQLNIDYLVQQSREKGYVVVHGFEDFGLPNPVMWQSNSVCTVSAEHVNVMCPAPHTSHTNIGRQTAFGAFPLLNLNQGCSRPWHNGLVTGSLETKPITNCTLLWSPFRNGSTARSC